MPVLKPNKFFKRVTNIDPQTQIKDQGFDIVFLDVDNTILPRDTHEIPEDINKWLEDLLTSGLKVCLLSNSFKEGVNKLGDELGFPVLTGSLKPLPIAFIRAFRKMGASRKNSVLIGDQVFTDSLGAHLVGMKYYMVEALSEVDLLHTTIFRKLEKCILRNIDPQD
ncbi:MAG: YqeG family HAD IIIA-type phosphatase [Eggerthellaceae bacterium]|nr:YqeG family HAD IIIA-type phosphatase [Eggerthellaceae bacterium]